ncbi:hypothetical protein [Pedobacter ginsengisoli]|uniref:hypothetical protein n=1 Tax=Pedobacter ginsengisoli TaxID=363852 RepID=UPI0025501B65|nr:hypothetical protein [Pedobacter ginsengisoli]
MRTIFVTAIVLCLFTSMKCKKETENCHHKIKFKNGSSRDIYAGCFDSSSGLFTANFYQVIKYDQANYKFTMGEIQSGKPDGFYFRGCAEEEIGEASQGKIYIVVLDANMLENTDPAELERQHHNLKTYELTIADLQKMNWSIEFKD